MADGPEPPALAHVERVLADAYQRELDQEENVWRSLPFFTTTLAVEVTAVFQVVDRLPVPPRWQGWLALLLLALSGLCSLAALLLLAASVKPSRFVYIAAESSLLGHAERLIREGQDAPRHWGAGPPSAVVTLKTDLARQYAEATEHNRGVNKRRERSQSVAGLMIICSVLTTLLLVAGTLMTHSLGSHGGRAHGSASPSPILAAGGPGGRPAGTGAAGASPAPRTVRAAAAADADRRQGVVGAARRGDHGGGTG